MKKFFSALIRFFAYIHCLKLLPQWTVSRYLFVAELDAIRRKQTSVLKTLLQTNPGNRGFDTQVVRTPFLLECAFLTEDITCLDIVLNSLTPRQDKDRVLPYFFVKILVDLGQMDVRVNVKCVEALFSKFPDYSRKLLLYQGNGQSGALLCATTFKHSDCVKFLLKKAKDEGVLKEVLSQTCQNKNPLQAAIYVKACDCAYAILDEMQDDLKLLETFINDSDTMFFAITWWLDRSNIDIFRFFITERLEKLNLCSRYRTFGIFLDLVNYPPCVHKGFFDIYWNVAKKYWPPSALCLQHDQGGFSPLDYATGILYKDHPKSFPMLMENFKKLLQIAIDENFLEDLLLTKKAEGDSTLMVAVKVGNEACVLEILKQVSKFMKLGDFVSHKNYGGFTVFDIVPPQKPPERSAELYKRQKRCMEIIKLFCQKEELENKREKLLADSL